MEKKYNFTYQTKNLVNSRTYIGVHSTNKLDDGYIGCGIYRQSCAVNRSKTTRKTAFSHAVSKYGYENFRVEILDFFDTAAEAYEEEAYLVDQKWVDSKSNYNLTIGGGNAPITKGNKHHDYISDIYLINIKTGKVEYQGHTANQIQQLYGFNQSAINEIFNGRRATTRGYFATRNLETWKEDRQKLLDKFSETRLKGSKLESRPNKAVKISAFTEDLKHYKDFNSYREVCRFFNKSETCTKTISDAIRATQTQDKPRVSWGYIWKFYEGK